jgi:hypothetical protein
MTKATTTRTRQAKKPASTKVCFVLRRYEVKKGILTGCVCHVIRSFKTVKGQEVAAEYQVWRYADGMICCDCKAKTECYHIRHVQEWEEATAEERAVRHAAREAKKVEAVAAKTGAPVSEVEHIAEMAAQAKQEKADAVEQHQAEVDAAKVRPNYETSEAASQRRMAAPLNGNQGFSLLKKAS